MRNHWSPYFAPATDTGGGQFSDVRAAMRAAIASHTGGSAEVAGASGEDDDERHASEDEETAESNAEAEADVDDEDDDKTSERGRGDERTRGADDDEDEAPADDDSPLSSDKAFQALQQKHANNPEALRKALLGDYTKKTQRLATERKEYEGTKRFSSFIEAFDEDPGEAIRLLAQMNRIDLTQLAGEGADTSAATPTAPALAAELVTKVTEDVKEALGPDLDYLADPIAKAVTKALERIVPGTVEQTVKPLREKTESLVSARMNAESQAAMAEFAKRHPDWQDHEGEILKLSKRLMPAKDMDVSEYLDLLYDTATRTQREERIKKTAERDAGGRFKKTLTRMNSAERGDESRGVPDARVRKTPPKEFSFEDAAKAALRGEHWADDDD